MVPVQQLMAMEVRAVPPPRLPACRALPRLAGGERSLFLQCGGGRRSAVRTVRAADGPSAAAAVAAAADLLLVQITWQIAVGAIAGVTPFVIAGIEFSKRIIAQKRCGVCGGSGLVLKNDCYVRCQGCGGFLPWQSWKRFFKG